MELEIIAIFIVEKFCVELSGQGKAKQANFCDNVRPFLLSAIVGNRKLALNKKQKRS
jgi:hypothetical protein